MVPVPTTSNVLYVWVPYTCFLIVVFIILVVSFVKHIKRVLKRRRVVMDYIEAEVLSKRPRIGRMYSSHREDAQNTFRSEGASSDCQMRNCGYRHPPVSASGMRGEAHPLLMMENRTTPRSVRSLRMPAVVDPSIFRHKLNGLEDSGQSLWFKDRLMYGYNNFAFSFDEDLGRSHTRRVLSSPRSPLPRGVHGREDVTLGHGYAPSMAVIDSEQESQHSSTGDDNSPAGRSRSGTADSKDSRGRERSPSEYVHNGKTSTSLKLPLPPLPPLLHQSHQGQEAHVYGAEGHPTICSYCGSVLADPVVVINGPHSSGTRPKKKPRYKRQFACADMNSASELSSQSAALPGSPQHLYTTSSHGASERDASFPNTPSTVSEAAYSSNLPSGHSASGPSHGQKKEEGGEERRTCNVHVKDRQWRGLRSLQRSSSQRSGAEQLARGLEVFTIERRHSSGEPSTLPGPSESTDHQRSTTTANQVNRTPSASLPSHSRLQHLSPTASPSSRPKGTSPLHLQSYFCVPDIAEMSSSTPSASTTTATGISLHGMGRSFPSDSVSSAGEEKELSSAAEDGSIFWLSGRCTDTQQTLV